MDSQVSDWDKMVKLFWETHRYVKTALIGKVAHIRNHFKPEFEQNSKHGFKNIPNNRQIS